MGHRIVNVDYLSPGRIRPANLVEPDGVERDLAADTMVDQADSVWRAWRSVDMGTIDVSKRQAGRDVEPKQCGIPVRVGGQDVHVRTGSKLEIRPRHFSSARATPVVEERLAVGMPNNGLNHPSVPTSAINCLWQFLARNNFHDVDDA